jgi:hypothetical protein
MAHWKNHGQPGKRKICCRGFADRWYRDGGVHNGMIGALIAKRHLRSHSLEMAFVSDCHEYDDVVMRSKLAKSGSVDRFWIVDLKICYPINLKNEA